MLPQWQPNEATLQMFHQALTSTNNVRRHGQHLEVRCTHIQTLRTLPLRVQSSHSLNMYSNPPTLQVAWLRTLQSSRSHYLMVDPAALLCCAATAVPECTVGSPQRSSPAGIYYGCRCLWLCSHFSDCFAAFCRQLGPAAAISGVHEAASMAICTAAAAVNALHCSRRRAASTADQQAL